MRSGTTWSVDMIRASSSVSPDQVEQREKEDPHDVDEVPIEPDSFDVVVVVGVELVAQARADEPGEERDTDDHVKSVQPRHGKVEEEEKLGVCLDVRPRGRGEGKVGPALVNDAGGQLRGDGLAVARG